MCMYLVPSIQIGKYVCVLKELLKVLYIISDHLSVKYKISNCRFHSQNKRWWKQIFIDSRFGSYRNLILTKYDMNPLPLATLPINWRGSETNLNSRIIASHSRLWSFKMTQPNTHTRRVLLRSVLKRRQNIIEENENMCNVHTHVHM